MSEQTPIWLRREGESAKAYAAFGLYRDMDPRERSIDAAYCAHSGAERGAKGAPGYFNRWAQEHEWAARAAAYDAHREAARLAERGTEEIEAFRDRQRKIAAAATEAAVQLLTKGLARLKNLPPEEIPPTALPSFFRAAAAVMEAGTNAEAAATGVTALLKQLEEAP